MNSSSLLLGNQQRLIMQSFKVEHLFQLEQLGRYYGGAFSFSPDGKVLAFVLQRAKVTSQQHQYPFLWGNDRADIWLIELPSGKPVRITNGEPYDVGYWAPAWSPNGQQLAILSTADSWVTADELLCVLLPEEERPKAMTIETAAVHQATLAWQTAWKGQKPTASILQSGVAPDLSQRSQRQLCQISITDNSIQVLITAPIHSWFISPDQQWVCILQLMDIYRPQGNMPLAFSTRYQLGLRLASLAQKTAIQPVYSKDVIAGSLRWSQDSSQLAFLSYPLGQGSASQIYCIDLNRQIVKPISTDHLNLIPTEQQNP